VGTLTAEMVALGLAVAFTSPGSVVTMIVLLSMPAGLRRGIAFICGWLLAFGVLALVLVFVFHGQDFDSKQTTPSRTASAVEVLLGVLLVVSSWRVYRRPAETTGPQSPPKWLDRIERTHWLVALAVGSLMLSYALSLAAVAEILKANVSTPDEIVASVVFALASIVTIAAPVVVVLFAPERSAAVLARWKAWMLANTRSIALIALMVIGAFLIARGAYDLAA
jgi:Sap, sulfolipid-1-addressing protein